MNVEISVGLGKQKNILFSMKNKTSVMSEHYDTCTLQSSAEN